MTKHILLFLLLTGPLFLFSQTCSTTDASGCVCPDGSQNCDLLPNIRIADYPLQSSSGYEEFPQLNAGNNYNQGPDDGRLRLDGSTPNVGYGPLTVRSQSIYICGTDTFTTNPGQCPDYSMPKQLIQQRIYVKNGNTMSYYDRDAGSMTYHPTHSHMHVDDWGIYTLRIEDPNDPNPLNWTIVGKGSKLAFCLMDYGTCQYYQNHCEDTLNNPLNSNSDFPNFGLGGGQYNCSSVEQGITSGYTDIYYKYLDGMWIDIPPGTCNGDYYIVVQIDPYDYFLEEKEDDNVIAVPITLSQQVSPGNPFASITPEGGGAVCLGDTLILTASAGSTYAWSTGETTQKIAVTTAGPYTVTVTNPCGTATSPSYTVNFISGAPTVTGDTVCTTGVATLSAVGSGTMNWYDAQTGGNFLATGNTYTTPTINTSTTYYVESVEQNPGALFYSTPYDTAQGGGGYLVGNQYLTFEAFTHFTLKTVDVYSQSAGTKIIELRDKFGVTLISDTQTVVAGFNTLSLDYTIWPGQYRLGVNGSSGMYRNNSGVNYNYGIPGILEIDNSSAGKGFYYFFYNWQVQLPADSCVSPRMPVVAEVSTLATIGFSGLSSTYNVTDPAATLSGNPIGGTFSGPGISGNTFDPALAGIGGPYTITYTYVNAYGCTFTSTQNVTVFSAAGVIDASLSSKSLLVYPNPSNGLFSLTFNLGTATEAQLLVTDLTGKMVYTRNLEIAKNGDTLELDFSMLGKGIYFLKVKADGKTTTRKLTIQ